MAVAIILGTRPEIIKMSPVIRSCQEQGVPFFIIHTGQHYSYEMERIFFLELELPEPSYHLDVGSGSHGEQTGKILTQAEKILAKERPEIVLVQGDTNTVFAGALAAVKLHLKVGHVEAGLRSWDRNMPEEINRILADHISDLLFAPTKGAKVNLTKEGIPEEKIIVTGNTSVDALYRNAEISNRRSCIMKKLDIEPRNYFLVTAHREENVDVPERLEGITNGLSRVSDYFSLPIIFPTHPRTQKRIAEFGLALPPGVRVTEPVGFLDFLQLESNASLILTDSGGVQEEACIFRVPCVTLRNSTERPETIEIGANILADCDGSRILECTRQMHQKPRTWDNPFGDGSAGDKIVRTIKSMLHQ